MSQKYKCWMPEYDEREDDALEIEPRVLFAPEEVASEACHQWLRRGKWSGDPIPSTIIVHVRAPNGTLYEAKVELSWSPEFYSYVPAKKIEEQR